MFCYVIRNETNVHTFVQRAGLTLSHALNTKTK